MRWFFYLCLLGSFAWSFNACERHSPEVLKALPGAGHHGEGHHEEGGHDDAHAEMAHGETPSENAPAHPETGHEQPEAESSH